MKPNSYENKVVPVFLMIEMWGQNLSLDSYHLQF